MPTNNPGVCTNCNIQNSNPSISNNASMLGFHDPNKIIILKRYNPGALLNTNLNTNEAISAVQNVEQQTRFDTGALSQQRKNTQTANQTTLNIIKNVLDVQSDVADIDKSGQRLRKNARQSVSKNIDEPIVPTTNKQIALNSLKTGRVEHALQPDQKDKKKQQNNEKNRMRNRKIKSVGTELASSLSFQKKFAVLLQQDIATENATIEFKIPSKFDGRKVWSDYISDIRSQGQCGSCWAFSSIFVLATRLSIYSRGKYNYIFSPAKMVFCGLSTSENSNDDFFKYAGYDPRKKASLKLGNEILKEIITNLNKNIWN